MQRGVMFKNFTSGKQLWVSVDTGPSDRAAFVAEIAAGETRIGLPHGAPTILVAETFEQVMQKLGLVVVNNAP